jgi:hypothetical protein
MCVQRFDDSLNSAIHITYRISLRSSSMPEPRDPLLKVLNLFFDIPQTTQNSRVWDPLAGADQPKPVVKRRACQSNKGNINKGWEIYPEGQFLCNDPSAGSPTERKVYNLFRGRPVISESKFLDHLRLICELLSAAACYPGWYPSTVKMLPTLVDLKYSRLLCRLLILEANLVTTFTSSK